MQNKIIKLFDISGSERDMTGAEYVNMLSKKELKKIKSFLTKINGKHVLLHMGSSSYYIGEVISVEKKSELSFVFNGYDVFSNHVNIVKNEKILVDHVIDHKVIANNESYNKKMAFLNDTINIFKDFSLKAENVSTLNLDYEIFSEIKQVNISNLSLTLEDLETTYKDAKIKDIIESFVLEAQTKNKMFDNIKAKVNEVVNKIIITKDKNTLISIPLLVDDSMAIYGKSLIITNDTDLLISCFPLNRIDLSNFKSLPSYVVNDNSFNNYFKGKINVIINTLTSYEKEFSILFGTEQ